MPTLSPAIDPSSQTSPSPSRAQPSSTSSRSCVAPSWRRGAAPPRLPCGLLVLIDEHHFITYRRVLNRAVWSPLQLSRILLRLVIDTFIASDQPLIIAVDDTLERRFGRRVAHKGNYDDAVRSKPGHPVTTAGIRCLCCAAIVRLRWSSRPWALPFRRHHPR